MPNTMVELDDRWILPLRGNRVTTTIANDTTVFTLEPEGAITVGADALFTKGPISAPGAAVLRLSQHKDNEIRQTAGAEILSAVAFKSGALRVVFSNGYQLNVRTADPAVPATVTSGDLIHWVRPRA